MRRLLLLLIAAGLAPLASIAQEAAPLRPPATPLIAHDPYFSVWSTADQLTAQPTKHWTGTDQPLLGLIRVDGKVLRFMGGGPRWASQMAVLPEKSRRITPTRTLYTFEGEGIEFDLTFLTPALAGDMDTLARPVTYLVFDIRATDRKAHKVRLYVDASSHIAVDTTAQKAMWSRHRVGNLEVVRLGSTEQRMLTRSGDNLRIDWGYFYLAAPGPATTLGISARVRASYAATLELPPSRDLEMPEGTDRDVSVAAMAMDADIPATGPKTTRYMMAAYDDIYSLEYFRRPVRPYWRRARATAEDLLTQAAANFTAMREKCERFDAELTADLVKAGGPKYAAVAILAYRQTLAAHKLAVDFDGSALHFSKENFSNGCMGTVDVIYPAAPLFLLLNPRLAEAQLRPVLDYARSGRWKFPYAPHDLGQYPLANGQVYGGGEISEDNQMPVEESGNMLILLGALVKINGNAEFSRPYFTQLTRWADFLAAKGMDPDNQLSTDDFAGHLAHNTNLSIKAILGLGSYAMIADALGEKAIATKYRTMAQGFAKRWPAMAEDGDHYRLAFDKPGTWSQKYNLVWDKILGLNLFDQAVARKEMAYYLKHQNKYGLPLDNRADYTKLDWIVWTATMAEQPRDFAALIDPVYLFLNETPDRVPMTDWYWTSTAKHRGFQARSVVGGVFIKMLNDPAMWKKWASKAEVSQ
ncbi:MAG: DUF4965 domain-containing protein [Bryobacteraceae bacterium]|nr:DUF4965 domain-containing protein [Bryobacteraceae bacterium]